MLKKKISMLLAATLVTVTFVSSKPVSASPIVKNENVNPKQQVQVVNNEKQAKEAINKSKGQKVTILYYCDADNNLEPYLLNDIEEMKRGYNNDPNRSEEHTSELQSRQYLVCRLLLEKKNTSAIT